MEKHLGQQQRGGDRAAFRLSSSCPCPEVIRSREQRATVGRIWDKVPRGAAFSTLATSEPNRLTPFCLSSQMCEETREEYYDSRKTRGRIENLTLRVCGAADHVGQFGFQAGGGGAVLAQIFHTARPHRHHALQRRVGPQTLGLVDRQRRGVVNQEASILYAKTKDVAFLDEVFYSKTWKNTVNCRSTPQKHSWISTINGRKNFKIAWWDKEKKSTCRYRVSSAVALISTSTRGGGGLCLGSTVYPG